MAELKTIARPYALAAFRSAGKHGDASQWLHALATLKPLAANRSLADAVAALPAQVEGGTQTRIKNFIAQLARMRRLPLLEHIHLLFEQYTIEAQNRVKATIISARPLESSQQTSLLTALEQRLGQPVEAVYQIDATLMAGVIVRVGDQTIDGSIKARLSRLTDALTH